MQELSHNYVKGVSPFKRLFLFFSAISFILLLVCCSSNQVASSDLGELDKAVREASNYLNDNLPKGNKLVVLNFQSEYQALSEYVIDELITNTVNDRVFTVVDRANLALIQREINFQLSGEVNDETAISIGRMLGAEIIISGAIPQIGDIMRLRVRALDVETTQIVGQFNRNIPRGQTVALLTGSSSVHSQSITRVTQPAQTSNRSTQTAALYKVGDIGPAGGFIFYDKGNSIGGWRYLEAAPAETEVTAPTFSPAGYNELVGSRRLGDGYENTKKFIELFQRLGGGINTAPWLCNELDVNGFSDWYLPSVDEVLLMYNNLYLKGLGELRNSIYWSSYVSGNWDIVTVNFSDGSEMRPPFPEGRRYQVRAVRRF